MKRILTLLMLSTFLGAASPAPAADLSPDPLGLVSPGRSFRTLHTSLDLDVDIVEQRIAGSVTHRMRSLRPGLTWIALNCVGLAVETVTIDGAEAAFDYPVPGTRTTSWIGPQEPGDADDQLVIHLPTAVDRGGEFDLTVRYHGSPRKGLYWIQPEKGLPHKRHEVWSQGEGEDNRYWVPCNDYPNDKSTFEGRFRVKKGLYALSNGNLVGIRELDGRTEFHWKLDEPQVSYLIMLAVAEYDVHEEERNGIQLLYVVPPGTPRETVDRCYSVTGDMLDFFEKTTGIDYPFGKYAQVVVQNFLYGGMENSTATVMNMRTLHDQGLELTHSEQGLVAHELAHMWWGDMVTCREWTHMWLNEGFATYYQGLFRQHHDGDDAFRYQMHERHASTVKTDDKDPRPVVTDFYNRKDARNNHNVYAKGASVLHMMRLYLGDELFHAVIREYAETRMHDTAETSDLTRAVKDVTGENLDWFFEQWLYLAGHPKFRVIKHWDAENGMLRLTVNQTQETGQTVPVFRVPLDVEITTGTGSQLHRIVVESAEQDFYFQLEEKPEMVIFDKGDWILKTLTFPKLTGELLYQLEHGDYMARVRAATALGRKGADDRTVPALAGVVMASGHYGLGRDAALALGRVGTEAARDALIPGLAADDARVRKACAEALGEFRHDETAAGALQNAISKDPAWEVRAAAVTSVVKLGSKDAERVCVSALEVDGGRGVVCRAGIEGLVKLGDPGVLSRVRTLATSGNDREHHRHTAISAYARLARKLEEDRDRESAADFLSRMLDDWYLRTRRTVIDGLKTLGEATAVPALRQAAASDPLESLRRRADRAADHIESGAGRKNRIAEVDRRVRDLERRLGTVETEMDKARGGE